MQRLKNISACEQALQKNRPLKKTLDKCVARNCCKSDRRSVCVPIIHIIFLSARHMMKTQIRACPVSLTEDSSVCTDPQFFFPKICGAIYIAQDSTPGCRQREPRHDADLHGGRGRSPRLIQNCSGTACILSSLSAPPLATRPASSQAAHSTCNRAQHLLWKSSFHHSYSLDADCSLLPMHTCMHGQTRGTAHNTMHED